MYASTLRALAALTLTCMGHIAFAEESAAPELPKACLDGTGPGWRDMTEDEFINQNTDDDTWRWDGNLIHNKGIPVGVLRTKKKFTNFELVVQWRHLKSGGNSGIFLWIQDETLKDLPKGKLPPGGIEVQVLDHGYAEQWEKDNGKKPVWFTTNGDVFPVGTSDMKPFPPVAPDGKRSFPTKELTNGLNEWNHYYVRAINGEVRLWVNGEEVSGGNGCTPASGYLALEAEGAPMEFKGLRIRELP